MADKILLGAPTKDGFEGLWVDVVESPVVSLKALCDRVGFLGGELARDTFIHRVAETRSELHVPTERSLQSRSAQARDDKTFAMRVSPDEGGDWAYVVEDDNIAVYRVLGREPEGGFEELSFKLCGLIPISPFVDFSVVVCAIEAGERLAEAERVNLSDVAIGLL